MRLIKRVVKTLLPQSAREWTLTLPLATALVVVGFSLLLDRNPVMSSRSWLLTPKVEQGGFFRISYDVEWQSRCRVTGYRFIIDSTRKTHIYDPDYRTILEGRDQFEISIQVPTDAAVGIAEYRGMVQYRCNWLQAFFPLETVISTREFEIVPPTEPVSVVKCPPSRRVLVQPYCEVDTAFLD